MTTTNQDKKTAVVVEDVVVPKCRLCSLNEKDKGTMIVPCQCPGSVHATCLEKWRIHRASSSEFYQCGQCQFYYHLPSREGTTDEMTNHNNQRNQQHHPPPPKWRRKCRMYGSIFWDFCVVTLLVQALVVGASWLIWYLDTNKVVAEALGYSVNCVSSQVEENNDYYCNHVGSIYYFLGFLTIAVVIGTLYLGFGCCLNAVYDEDEFPPMPEPNGSFYRKRHQRRQQRETQGAVRSSLQDQCCMGSCGRWVATSCQHLQHDARVAARMTTVIFGGICGTDNTNERTNEQQPQQQPQPQPQPQPQQRLFPLKRMRF